MKKVGEPVIHPSAGERNLNYPFSSSTSPSVTQDYDAQDLIDFEETILQGVGYEAQGKVSQKELTMILMALPNDEE